MFKEKTVIMKFDDYENQDVGLTDNAKKVIAARLAPMTLEQMMAGLEKGDNVEFVFGWKLGSPRPPAADEATAEQCRECIIDTLPEDFDYVWPILKDLGVIQDGLEVEVVYEVDDETGEVIGD